MIPCAMPRSKHKPKDSVRPWHLTAPIPACISQCVLSMLGTSYCHVILMCLSLHNFHNTWPPNSGQLLYLEFNQRNSERSIPMLQEKLCWTYWAGRNNILYKNDCLTITWEKGITCSPWPHILGDNILLFHPSIFLFFM